MMRMILGIWVTLGLIPAASASADLSGKWEAQTMGTDRSVTVEHSGQQLAVHRVLWPEFEGKRYKLEHLFRGTIKGQRISGQLLVREDSAPQYEELRAFDGKVSSAASITIDGIPLKRVGQAPVATPAPPATKATTPPPAPPPTVTPPPPPPKNKPEEKRPKPPAPPVVPPPTPEAPPPAKKSGLLTAKVKPAISAMAQKFAKQGDDAYAAGDYDEALSLYRRAARAATGMPAVMLHRMGRAHLALGEYGQAYKWLYRALRKDPTNAAMLKEFDEAKRKR